MTISPPAAAPQASRAPRDTESRVSGSRRKPISGDSSSGPAQVVSDGARRARSFSGSRISKLRPERWWRSWANRAQERALFCTFWARLMRLLRERYTARQPTWPTLSPREAAAFRNREIGYVWQFHYLLPEFTALENVAMPLLARGMRKAGGAWRGGELAERGGFGGSRRASARRAFRRRAAARGAGSGAGMQPAAAAGR